MSIPAHKVEAALSHLQVADPILAEVIREVGTFRLKLERQRFRMLVRSIISQQISTKAARAIRLRLDELVGPGPLTPERILQFTPDELRAVGLSTQKVGYLLDLTEQVNDGRVALRTIGRKSDEDIIRELTQVRGIGRWTAQMFLIFSLGRLDVFPHDDLGVRAALKRLYALEELPNKNISLQIAEPWRPYASVASWYCWRSGDLVQQQVATTDDYPV
jgi:DNA-3-methyladenine glycosylase II